VAVGGLSSNDWQAFVLMISQARHHC